ncbi:fibrobacter succinogenes major paralogous domain-containing protein, partial [Winogradskyella sp.]|uniref:fibrobacter succinogenes major paralogous domain-containing protein n=1 Tax=Winogradskyella sp. TaxID=1883156 RepID=UPI0035C8419B
NSIEWDNGPYFIETETDPTGGSNYSIIGNSQLLSVPYALYAKNSGNSTPTTPNLEAVLSENNSANNQQIKDLQDPTEAQDAVTKNYTYSKAEVDALLANLQSQIDALSPSITDVDGNTYNYLTYGGQVWTEENAEMVTYRDGTPIPEVTDNAEWESLTTGAWSYYDNDPTKPRLYNWYAVMGIHDVASLTDASLRKEFAPEGWHVPSDAEWTTLEEHLIANGYNYDGTTTGNKIAKSMASTTGWDSDDFQAGTVGNYQSLNNGSGFNAFPGGLRYNLAPFFSNEGGSAFFWSSTENTAISVWNRSLTSTSGSLGSSTNPKQFGFSVRFVRD